MINNKSVKYFALILYVFFSFSLFNLEAIILKINKPNTYDNDIIIEDNAGYYVSPPSLKEQILNEVKTNLFAYIIGLVVGIVVFLIIRPENKCRNPKEMARRWLAWGLLASIATGLSQIFAKGEEEGLPAALLGISFFSATAWLLGYLFGKTKFWLMPNTSIEPIIEEQIYAKVAQEIADNQMHSGVMARAFSQSKGDENKAKALYIKFRVRQLILNHHDEVKRRS